MCSCGDIIGKFTFDVDYYLFYLPAPPFDFGKFPILTGVYPSSRAFLVDARINARSPAVTFSVDERTPMTSPGRMPWFWNMTCSRKPKPPHSISFLRNPPVQGQYLR